MRKLVSKLSELPSEFSLERYGAAPSLSLAGWLRNLEFRSLRRFMLSVEDDHYAEECRESSLYLFRRGLVAEQELDKESPGLRKHIYVRQVRDRRVFDELAGQFWFQPDETRLEKYVKAFQLLEEPLAGREADPGVVEAKRLLFDVPMWQALSDAGIDDEAEVSITVNLHASESQLVDDFRRWLTDLRAARGLTLPRRKISPADLDDWARYQVLPYLDLTFWAKAHGSEITNQVLGLALFPDEYEVALADRVRKVVAPMANRIVSEEFCDVIRAQALAEAEEAKEPISLPGRWDSVFVTEDGSIRLVPDD